MMHFESVCLLGPAINLIYGPGSVVRSSLVFSFQAGRTLMSKCNIPCAGSKASFKIGTNDWQGRKGFGLPATFAWQKVLVAAKRVWNHSAASAASAPVPFAREIRLEAHQLWSGGFSSAVRISCESGCVWVTRRGDLHDYIVREGEEIMAPHSPHLVISTIGGPALFQIQAPGAR